MAVTFIELLEGTDLSEEMRSPFKRLGKANWSEAREEVTAELREEFAPTI